MAELRDISVYGKSQVYDSGVIIKIIMKKILLTIVLLFALCLMAKADTLTIQNEGVTIRTGAVGQYKDTNFLTSSTRMIVGDVSLTDVIRGVCAFPLDDPLLAGATINSVTVTVVAGGTDSGSDSAEDFTIQECLSFVNTEVTWNNRDASTLWTTPGGDYGAVLDTKTLDPRTIPVGTSVVFSGEDLTAAVANNLGGTFNSLFKIVNESDNARDLIQFQDQVTLTIDYTSGITANTPSPADEDSDVEASVALGWKHGIDPANPSVPNPAMQNYLLTYRTGDPNFLAAGTTTVEIDADVNQNGQVDPDASYGPITFGLDQVVYWKVDEIIADANDILGSVWSFTTHTNLPALTYGQLDFDKLCTNYATSASITVSSSYSASYPKENLNDGIADITDNTGRWISSSTLPHTVTFTLPAPVTISACRIFSGYNNGGVPAGPIEDFVLQYYDGRAWRDITETQTSANKAIVWAKVFSPVYSDRFKLTIIATPNDTARIWEIELLHPNADIEQDGFVQLADLQEMALCWLTDGTGCTYDANINAEGIIDLADFSILSKVWDWPYLAKGGRPLTIMPLGDSITEGSDYFYCYRPILGTLLSTSGYSVEFVGTRYSNEYNEMMYHEGYSGQTAEYLAANIQTLYTTNPADIILLHAGHNYFSENDPVNQIVQANRDIITTASSINPDVVVLLAKVIVSGKLPKYSYIPELNQALASLAGELNQLGYNVVLVDQAEGFDPYNDTIDDNVHPNASGAQKMAEKWYQALCTLK